MEQNIENAQGVQNGVGNALAKKLWLLLPVFVFLLPVFFVPVEGISLYVGKVALLATGLVAVFAVFLSTILSTGAVEIPRAKYLIPIGVFAVAVLVASIFSGSIKDSIMGTTFDLGTSGSLIMLVFSLFVTLVAVRSLRTVSNTVLAFIYSAVALAVYTLFGTFVGPYLPAATASRIPLFLSGGAIDSAIIFGAAAIAALCVLNMSETSKRTKIILYIFIAYAMAFIGATNFTPAIIVLGLVSLIFFVYVLSWSVGHGGSGDERKMSLPSLIILMVSVIFILSGTGIGNYLSKMMKIQTIEIRPNFETTMDLTLASWQKNVAFGVGPNRFAEFWALHKPIEINQTQFWNTDFYSGSGFIPTIAITTGLVGLLSFLAFIAMYLTSGVKAIFAQANASRSRYLATTSFLVSLYLWIVLFLYPPSIVVMALAFIFTGLFTATLAPQGIISLWKTNIFSNPKTNFLAVLSIVILLIMSVAGGYFVWERAIASVIFERGALGYQKGGDIGAVRESTARAIGMVQSDIYWRGLTEISLLDLGRVLSGVTDQSQMTDAIRAEAQALIADSVESGKKAVEIDGSNFQNWFALARVYEVLASNGIEGALENARANYAEAALRSPNNPSVPLAIARLDALSGKTDDARANIGRALELKGNYTDAYYTLAQLEVAVNNIPGAIRSVEAAAVIDPNNSGLYFQLGLLKYNQKDFAGAASALGRAVALVPDYANAKYFLGLSYYQIGRKEEALKQFEEISATNPDNQEITLILSNMKAGRALFPNATIDKNELPIEED